MIGVRSRMEAGNETMAVMVGRMFYITDIASTSFPDMASLPT